MASGALSGGRRPESSADAGRHPDGSVPAVCVTPTPLAQGRYRTPQRAPLDPSPAKQLFPSPAPCSDRGPAAQDGAIRSPVRPRASASPCLNYRSTSRLGVPGAGAPTRHVAGVPPAHPTSSCRGGSPGGGPNFEGWAGSEFRSVGALLETASASGAGAGDGWAPRSAGCVGAVPAARTPGPAAQYRSASAVTGGGAAEDWAASTPGSADCFAQVSVADGGAARTPGSAGRVAQGGGYRSASAVTGGGAAEGWAASTPGPADCFAQGGGYRSASAVPGGGAAEGWAASTPGSAGCFVSVADGGAARTPGSAGRAAQGGGFRSASAASGAGAADGWAARTPGSAGGFLRGSEFRSASAVGAADGWAERTPGSTGRLPKGSEFRSGSAVSGAGAADGWSAGGLPKGSEIRSASAVSGAGAADGWSARTPGSTGGLPKGSEIRSASAVSGAGAADGWSARTPGSAGRRAQGGDFRSASATPGGVGAASGAGGRPPGPGRRSVSAAAAAFDGSGEVASGPPLPPRTPGSLSRQPGAFPETPNPGPPGGLGPRDEAARHFAYFEAFLRDFTEAVGGVVANHAWAVDALTLAHACGGAARAPRACVSGLTLAVNELETRLLAQQHAVHASCKSKDDAKSAAVRLQTKLRMERSKGKTLQNKVDDLAKGKHAELLKASDRKVATLKEHLASFTLTVREKEDGMSNVIAKQTAINARMHAELTAALGEVRATSQVCEALQAEKHRSDQQAAWRDTREAGLLRENAELRAGVLRLRELVDRHVVEHAEAVSSRAAVEKLCTGLQSGLQQAAAENAALRAQLAAEESDGAAYRERLHRCVADMESLVAANGKLSSIVDLLQDDISCSNSQNADISSQLAATQTDYADIEVRLDLVSREKEALHKQLEGLQSEVDGGNVSIGALEARIKELEAKRVALETQCHAAHAERSELLASRESLARDLADAAQAITALQESEAGEPSRSWLAEELRVSREAVVRLEGEVAGHEALIEAAKREAARACAHRCELEARCQRQADSLAATKQLLGGAERSLQDSLWVRRDLEADVAALRAQQQAEADQLHRASDTLRALAGVQDQRILSKDKEISALQHLLYDGPPGELSPRSLSPTPPPLLCERERAAGPNNSGPVPPGSDAVETADDGSSSEGDYVGSLHERSASDMDGEHCCRRLPRQHARPEAAGEPAEAACLPADAAVKSLMNAVSVDLARVRRKWHAAERRALAAQRELARVRAGGAGRGAVESASPRASLSVSPSVALASVSDMEASPLRRLSTRDLEDGHSPFSL
ncbi:hypothetical protein DIPPA_10079 [Diplonema papillatum]|nr:hypothetical protein DIPPA_10079 [Diplonema papillatum]